MPRFRRTRAVAVATFLTLFVGVYSVDYTVQPGDTLGRIARDAGVSLSDLVELNGIANPDLIHPGQVLVIPGSDVTHVVTRGETLAKIATAYGSSITAIAGANGIKNPDLIRIGQNIVVPPLSSVRAPSTKPSNSAPSSGAPTSSAPAIKATRSGRYHIVRGGESLDAIAANHSGVTASQIADANGIVGKRIYRGTRLFLDGPAYVGEGTAGETTYRIQTGDRLGDIAAQFGITLTRLVEVNAIKNPNLIRSGSTLQIPSGTRWVCPIQGASFFNDWGFPRAGGVRYHEGNDLFTAHGSPVYAPVSGMVEFETGSIGGKQFTLYGDDGVEYLGSHMSEFGKSGKVGAGDIVGYVGNSGNAIGTRPHLHFGMYLSDLAINPYPTLLAHGCK